MSWTPVTTPTSQNWNAVLGKYGGYDDLTVTYDDPSVTYDGGGIINWVQPAGPTAGTWIEVTTP